MKKIVTLFLIIALLLPVSALAAGKLVATQENFYVIHSWNSFYGYTFMKLENTGNKPVEFSAGLFEIYDANGDTLASDSSFTTYGRYVAPGEYIYAQINEEIKEIDNPDVVDDYMLTVTGKSTNNELRKITCTAEYKPDYQYSKYSSGPYMFATFTNESEDIVYGLRVVFALLDDEDNILYIEGTSIYDSVGLHPGATVTAKCSVSDRFIEAYEKAGLKATHVDAYAYYTVNE